MNRYIMAAMAAIILFLIFRSIGNNDVEAEACAKEVIQLLRKNPEADATEIAEIFKAHGRTKTDIGKVTPIIKAKMAHSQILKQDQPEVMRRVVLAKNSLTD